MYLVYGLQKSGISIVRLFEKKNTHYKVWDDNKNTRNKLNKDFPNELFYNPKIDKLNNFKKIYVSPGISLRQEKFKIRNRSIKLQRDLNLYINNIDKEKVIAITGTNGKSTTTKLIGDILKKNNLKTFVGGNIGEPLCNAFKTKKKYNFHVVELSSFQLETVKNINSKISIITNLSNDHLDRYTSLKDYIKQKKNIISKSGINLISIDDKYSRKIFDDKNIKNKISFSLFDTNADFFIGENYILDNYFKNNRKLYIKSISKDFEGYFNHQNILIAYICSKLLNLSIKNFLSVIKNFKGLPYRSKVIHNDKRLKIINNSKSTNISSAINSIKNYNNIYLIMGGIAKEKNFKDFINYKKKINRIYVFGKSASFISAQLKSSFKVSSFKNLNLLIKRLFKDLEKSNIKSNVLFAPACTSFDQYKNFEERGSNFSKLISNFQIKS